MQDVHIEVNRSEFAYKQISRHFEELIVSGQLKPGDRIAPTQELARKFSVTPNTIQKSLALLARKGILTRSRKRGTVVSPSACSNNLGLVFGFEDMFNQDNGFWGALFKELKKLSEKIGWKCKPYLGLENNFNQVLQDIESDIARGELKSLIPLCYPASICKWLNEECSVPWTTIESTAECDYDEAIVLGMRHLLKNERQKIGIVSPFGPKGEDADVTTYALASLNISSNIHSITYDIKGRESGNKAVKRIFQSNAPKPDALFFFDDRACEGGVMALFEMGLKIPADIQVLSLANRGVEIMSPVEISRIEFNPSDFARSLIDSLMSRINGEAAKAEKLKVKGILKTGLSTGKS
jgi:hypothetical protein